MAQTKATAHPQRPFVGATVQRADAGDGADKGNGTPAKAICGSTRAAGRCRRWRRQRRRHTRKGHS
eukprot:52113-Chlamydomonas_euryale.AAC.1